jgi:hypothetical protein
MVGAPWHDMDVEPQRSSISSTGWNIVGMWTFTPGVMRSIISLKSSRRGLLKPGHRNLGGCGSGRKGLSSGRKKLSHTNLILPP